MVDSLFPVDFKRSINPIEPMSCIGYAAWSPWRRFCQAFLVLQLLPVQLEVLKGQSCRSGEGEE